MEGNTLETALGLVYSVLPIYSDYNNNIHLHSTLIKIQNNNNKRWNGRKSLPIVAIDLEEI
jgi:hypothetical protein